MDHPASENQAGAPVGEQAASYDLSVEDLDLPTRAQKALLDGGIDTVGKALDALKAEEDLLTLKGFGSQSLNHLKEQLESRGFDLADGAELRARPNEAKASGAEEPEGEATEGGTSEEIEGAGETSEDEEGSPEPSLAAGSTAASATETTDETDETEKTEEAGEALSPAASAGEAAEVEADAGPSLGQRIGAVLAQVGLGRLMYAVLALLLLVILFVPPFSLLRRMGLIGYTTLNAANSLVSHDDGLTVQVDPENFEGRLRVQLDAVPRLEFLEGSAGRSLRKAVEALPSHLEVKSPYYTIQSRGKSSQPVMIDVVMPNNAEPWQTLDLCTWDGEDWIWLGSELHVEKPEEEFIRAQVTEMPVSVVVAQTDSLTSTVSASVAPDAVLDGMSVFDHLNPTGLLLGTMGGFAGQPVGLPQPGEGADYELLPVLRNWAPGKSTNIGLLTDLLEDAEVRAAHIANIISLCKENNFAGIEIDYRGLTAEQGDAYTAFIEDLAAALHAEGLQLSVIVERPTFIDETWDTGSYDWKALGAAADALKVPFPAEPTAYEEGGEAESLLDWATAQVPRHKLHMLVSSLSAMQASEDIRYVSLEQALAPFGEVTALTDLDQVEPNTRVKFGLAGSLLGIAPQDATGTYQLEYQSEGETHTVWPGTPDCLDAKMRWARDYNLGGVSVADALDPGNADGILDAVRSYKADGAAVESQNLEVSWTVAQEDTVLDQRMSPLTDPAYTWTAPEVSGTYNVRASINGFDHGSVMVNVRDPEPEETEPLTETETITDTESVTETEEAEREGLSAVYVADVTIPDNTQLENGEAFEKTWRVRNNGTEDWPEDTVLAFFDGDQMGAPDSVEVGTVEPGGQIELTVPMEAPEEPGRYQATWRMKTADGFFGGNLTVLIQAGEVEEENGGSAQPPDAPPPSGGGAFELGAHITSGSLPYAGQMRQAGMTWVKEQVHYRSGASGLIANAHANGFKVQLSAIGGAAMVTEPGFEENYASWVADLAAAGADAIEVWNEPNIDREWQAGHISPQAYTDLLCTAYAAIKNANPNTAVISAAPSPTGFFGGCSADGCDDQPWLQGLVNAGAAQCMDYIGAHHNSGATSPSASSGHPADASGGHHSWYFLPQTRLYYNIFGGARKIFYTEMGYASQEGLPTFSDDFAWARGIDNAKQAAWLQEAAQLSINTGMVRCIIIWNVGRSRYGYDPQDGYNIIRPDGSCPACDALGNVLGAR